MKNSQIKLVIFDLDDTLTTGPTIWELIHKINGTWASHGLPYWRAFCRKEFGYDAFIRKDVACWKGLPLAQVKKAMAQVKYIPGLAKTIRALKKKKIKTAIISSSLEIFAGYVARKSGIDHVLANPVGIKDGQLTGQVRLKVPGRGKGRITRQLRKKLGFKKAEVLAVGDSHYDLAMFREAGLSVSFHHAHDQAKKHAHHVIARNKIGCLTKLI